MNVEEKLKSLYHSFEQTFEQESNKRLEIASELKGLAKAVAVLNIISLFFRGLIIFIIFFVLAILIGIYSFKKRKAPKKAFLPLRARDYINQQTIFYQTMHSNEPFILVLRSFEQNHYLSDSGDVGDLDKHMKKESDYEAVEGNIIERLETSFASQVKLFYVGKTRSCGSMNRLTKSLFLISDNHWFDSVELLIEKCLFIILMPGNTKGLLKELTHISNKGLNKTYFFLPRLHNRSNKMIDSWLKTFEEFQKVGLMLPYENNSKKDCIFKVEEYKMTEVGFDEAFKFHISKQFEKSKDIIEELLENKYISSDYYKECLKYFNITRILKKFKAVDIFDEIAQNKKLWDIQSHNELSVG